MVYLDKKSESVMMTISEKLDSMESIIATMIEMQQQQLNALLVMKQALKEVACDYYAQ